MAIKNFYADYILSSLDAVPPKIATSSFGFKFKLLILSISANTNLAPSGVGSSVPNMMRSEPNLSTASRIFLGIITPLVSRKMFSWTSAIWMNSSMSHSSLQRYFPKYATIIFVSGNSSAIFHGILYLPTKLMRHETSYSSASLRTGFETYLYNVHSPM